MGDLGPTLLLFPVVGYLLLRHRCHRTSFRWDALEWQQNVFESTGVGLLLFAVARLGAPLYRLLPEAVGAPLEQVASFLNARLPIPYAAAAVGSILIGLLLAWAANRRWPPDRALELVVGQHGGRLRILLHAAHRTKHPVMLSLSNRKVYVGLVYVPPPLRKPSHVVLFPTLSGYRETDTLAVRWVTNYYNAYKKIVEGGESGETALEGFQLVLPLDTIQSATYFDIDIYTKHFAPNSGDAPAATPSSETHES